MSDQDLIRQRLRQWAEAAPTLEALRREEIRTADNRQVLTLLEPAFNHAIRTLPPRSTSGMVEMQRLFAKLRR
ncbi:MAG: hypothetical protein IPJ98_22860 [Bryobacterales bacterium]|nr:hypothetical protein [Bryobacterales bacterium]